jgi:hypothetical protein
MMRTLLLATMKNEGPFLLEWVAWHRLVGFDDIVVAQNDSDDLTAEMLSCLEDIGAVTFLDNSDPGNAKVPGNHQGRAYSRIAALPVYAKADWAIALDADEFMAVKIGAGKVADLIAEIGGDVDQIHIHWNLVGSNGLTRFEDDLVTTRFTETHAAGRSARQPTLFKTLYRRSAFSHAGPHRPVPVEVGGERSVTASGIRVPTGDLGRSSSKDPGAGKFAQIFHYRIRDAESFVLAKTRGRPGANTVVGETLGYWLQSDSRTMSDTFMAKQRGRILSELAELDRLSAGRLMDLHRRSVSISKERIAAFKTDPQLREFYDQVCRLQGRIRGPDERSAIIELYEKGEIQWRPK